MNKKNILIALSTIFVAVLVSGILISLRANEETQVSDVKELSAKVINIDEDYVTVQDSDNVIYTFLMGDDLDIEVGEFMKFEYTGDLDRNFSLQNNEIIDYTSSDVTEDENGIPIDFLDNGIFKDYYKQAYKKLKELSLEEKIAQILLVRYPDNDGVSLLKNKQFGGYVFFEKDFKDKSSTEVKNMINDLQDVSNIPILTATDEEGGKVVRVSSNSKLASLPFKSSKELYKSGGFEAIREDTRAKSNLLYSLGINVNLAPVVDVSTNSTDYMYDRALICCVNQRYHDLNIVVSISEYLVW